MRAGLEETLRVTLSDGVGVADVRWASESGKRRRERGQRCQGPLVLYVVGQSWGSWGS